MNKKLITFVLLGIAQNLYPMERENHRNIRSQGELVCRAGLGLCAGVAGITYGALYHIQMMNNRNDVILEQEKKGQDVAVAVGLGVLVGYSLGTALTDLRNAYDYNGYLNAIKNSKKEKDSKKYV